MKNLFIVVGLLIGLQNAQAQGIHFSQFFNSPMLLNPANTANLAEDDYRAGINYRNQYQNVTVPYNTFSAFTDFGIGRNNNENNWWGVGGAFWKDQAGAGNLSMTKVQGNVAYHIAPNENNLISFGASVGYVSRSVNLANLTFDSQWDEFSFNNDLPNLEKLTNGKTSYLDIQTGVSFAHFNNDKIYYKFGASVLHLNQPKEAFLGSDNRIGLRPVLDFEFSYKAQSTFLLTPSIYYTSQKAASEIIIGFMTTKSLTNSGTYFRNDRNELLTGLYYRVGDAIILMSGYRWKNTSFMLSYDQTVSGLVVANKGVGAIELSLIFSAQYKTSSSERRILGCPRM